MKCYFCIIRPPQPGVLPIGVRTIQDYAGRRYVPEIDRMAWGCVEYERELEPAEIFEYGLISEPREDEWE